jgi:uncharacterized membrane protein YcjF (UPF0283 family)
MMILLLPLLFGIAIVAWGVQYVWRRRKGLSGNEPFYYHRSYWVIFTIILLLVLLIDIFLTVIRVKSSDF